MVQGLVSLARTSLTEDFGGRLDGVLNLDGGLDLLGGVRLLRERIEIVGELDVFWGFDGLG